MFNDIINMQMHSFWEKKYIMSSKVILEQSKQKHFSFVYFRTLTEQEKQRTENLVQGRK